MNSEEWKDFGELMDEVRLAEVSEKYKGHVDVDAQWRRFMRNRMASDAGTDDNRGAVSCCDGKRKGSTRNIWFACSAVAACVAVVIGIYISISRIPDGVDVWSNDDKVCVSVAPAATYSFELPDGTEVELLPGSRLTYPKRFVDRERRVELSGEGFFCVTHDAQHPFIVATSGAEVEVLGTRFNVRAYEGETYNVALIEGSVKVRNAEHTDSLLMRPGENVKLTGGNKLVLESGGRRVDMWQKGMLDYDNMTLGEIIRDIERNYGIKLCVSDSSMLDKTLHFSVSRKLSIDEVVERLNALNAVEVQVKTK